MREIVRRFIESLRRIRSTDRLAAQFLPGGPVLAPRPTRLRQRGGARIATGAAR